MSNPWGQPVGYAPRAARSSGSGCGGVLKFMGCMMALCMVFGLATCATCTHVISLDRDDDDPEHPAVSRDCDDAPLVTWSLVTRALDLDRNRVLARWRDACAQIEGTVHAVDGATITVGEAEPYLTCEAGEEEEVEAGDPVIVWGIGAVSRGDLVLEDCHLR